MDSMRQAAEQFAHALQAIPSYGLMSSDVALDIADTFGLDAATPFGAAAVLALMERRLIKANAVPEYFESRFFEFEGIYQKGRHGWPAWIMPVLEQPAWGQVDDSGDGPEVIVDLIAFAVGGQHDGKVWRFTGACDVLGWRRPTGDVLDVFTSPYLWLMNWLRHCERAPSNLFHAETGPESCGALVLDPRKVDWSPWRVERGSDVTSRVKEMHFDSPALRDQVMAEMKMPARKLPRLRALKRRVAT